MPELPEVETVRRQLAPAMVGFRFERVILRRKDLRQPFPRRLVSRLEGATVESLSRRAKYLLAALSSGHTLIVHLGMSGSFRIERDVRFTAEGFDPESGEPERHDHVIFHMSSGATLFFNDPRRFGIVDLARTDAVRALAALSGLGPEPHSDEFDGETLAAASAGKRTPIKVALLDQRVAAGVGNIYASEALHRVGLSPRRTAAVLATKAGRPRAIASRLAQAIKDVLNEAIERAEGRNYRSSRFRVYEREGEPCLRAGCNGRIKRITQAGRSTFYCPMCQR